jgi:hypothetical protein
MVKNLNYEYHSKIKILTKEGLEYGNFQIPLRKNDSNKEEIFAIEAATYGIDNGQVVKNVLDKRSVFYEKNSRYADFAKFTLSNVHVGSVIEVKYTIKTPFILNFWPWEFQREIPKQQSEYWAKIQANYSYNISLRGFLKLTKDEASLVNSCFSYGSSKADCSLYKFGMKDIPAFKEEQFMTAKSNFISAVNFELSEIKYFDGRVDKVTKEWKDVEDELMKHENFGDQLKKAKNLTEDLVPKLVIKDSSSLFNAKRIFDWVNQNFSWNDEVGKYSEFGVKKAFETKVGNAADINFVLLGCLQNAGLEAQPVILSTRSNGTPASSLYPVLSDYNYVIVRLEIGKDVYLLDATDKLLPFGLLPMRCLNGTGRLLAKKKSDFINLNAANGKQKKYTSINLRVNESGNITGKVQISYSDYDASARRKIVSSFDTPEEQMKKIQSEWNGAEISNYANENLKDISKPFIEKLEIEFAQNETKPKQIYFNPFLKDKWTENPFKSTERSFPVDFGAPLQQVLSVTIQLPENYEVDDFPKSVSLALPGDGGKFVFAASRTGNMITLRNSLSLNKAIYNSLEYHYLKELIERVVQLHQTDLVFLSK